MKLYIHILLLFFFVSCSYKQQGQENSKDLKLIISDSIGVGILIPALGDSICIPLYKSLDSEESFDTLFIKCSDSTMTIKNKLLKDKLNPFDITDKYDTKLPQKNIFNLEFRVVDISGRYYQIVINEITKETAVIKIPNDYEIQDGVSFYILKEEHELDPNYIQNLNFYTYLTWNQYLKCIGFVTLKDQLIIYDKPDGKIIFEDKNNPIVTFEIKKVDGDWAQITVLEQYEINGNLLTRFDNNWIKWKQNNRLLIKARSFK